MTCDYCATKEKKWVGEGLEVKLYNVGLPRKYCSETCLGKFFEINDYAEDKHYRVRNKGDGYCPWEVRSVDEFL